MVSADHNNASVLENATELAQISLEGFHERNWSPDGNLQPCNNVQIKRNTHFYGYLYPIKLVKMADYKLPNIG